MGRPKKAISQSNLERFHNELELVGYRTELLLRDKKGRSRSCLLCRRRKQKCDHKQPSCTTCLKACVKCIQPARYRSLAAEESCTDSSPSPSVTSAGGFNGIEVTSPLIPSTHIEANKSNVNNENGEGDTKHIIVDSSKSMSAFDAVEHDNNARDSRTLLQNIRRSSSAINEKWKDEYTSSLEKKVRKLEELLARQSGSVDNMHSCCCRRSNEIDKHGNILPPLNGGLASRLIPLRRLSGNNSVGNLRGSYQVKTIPFLASDTLQSIDLLKCLFTKYNLKEFFSCDPAFYFDEQISRSLLETFFSRYQFKYPLLDEDEIYTFHDNYVNNNIYFYSETEFHFACGRMWLIFSISGCITMTTGGYKGQQPNRYFSKAFRHITRCGDNLTYVQQAVLLTLLVLYLIRTDRDSLVLYDIIKDVMFICRDKLHLNTWRPNDPNAHKHLRFFWCVYLLERMICVAVGKPYTITESEIDLPLFDEISFNTRTINGSKGQHICVHFINQSLMLRRLESEFVETLQLLPCHKTRRRISPDILHLVRKYFHALETWRDNCSKHKIKNIENETLKLYFYRSVRLLIQPYLEFLGPEDRLFSECQTAAGQICQLFKTFHQKTVTGHSTPSVQTVFIAGVTLIYCMCLTRNNDAQKRKNLNDKLNHVKQINSINLVSALDDLKACSICLYVMTERSGFARTFRDIFDQLLSTTIGSFIERCPGESGGSYIPPPQKNGEETGNCNVANYGEQVAKENHNGIGPANASKIFDAGKTEEPSVIVDAPNVEVEGEDDPVAKESTLEQVSVPKSLAHLLLKVEHNGNKLCEGTPETKRTRCHSHDEHRVSKGHTSKKPCSGRESDQKMFGEKALLQQCSVEQRPQTDLHAFIHYEPTEDGRRRDTSENTVNFPTTGQLCGTRHTAGLYGLDCTGAVIPKSKFTVPTIDIQNNRSPNSQYSGNKKNSENINATLTLPHPGIFLPSVPSSQPDRSPQFGSSIFPKEDYGNMATTLNTNIPLSTDARDMINDISAWTTNSFPNPINERAYKGDIPSPYPIGSTELDQGRNNITSSVPSLSSATSHQSSQDRQKASTRFSLSNIVHPSKSPSFADSRCLKSCGTNTVKLPSSPSIRDFVVDEFWTVNDDYGFLI